jgi:micrococcal nuclease
MPALPTVVLPRSAPRPRLARGRRNLVRWLILGGACGLILWSWWGHFSADSGSTASSAVTVPTADDRAWVQRVIDGDTVLLADNRRVRLLGIDTPETKHPSLPVQAGGIEASQLLQALVEGQEVRLEFDKNRLDRHGRWLAYLFRGELFINAELVRAGWSRAETAFPLRSGYKKLLKIAEDEARRGRRGLWATGQMGSGRAGL